MAANPYVLGPGDRANADTLNARFGDVALRLVALEGLSPAVAVAIGNLLAVGLKQVRDQLLPLILLEQARVERGVLIAASATPVALVAGTPVTLVVDADDRDSFSPSAFVTLTRTSTPDDYATLRTVAWDRAGGSYSATVVAATGDPGPWDDWQLGSQAGGLAALETILARVQAQAAAVHDDRLATEAAAITTSTNAQSAASSAAQASAASGYATRLAAGTAFLAQSTSGLTIGVGSVSAVLTPATRPAFTVSQYMALISASDPRNAMCGLFESYDPASGTLALAVLQTSGSGSHADWMITPAIPPLTPAIIDDGYYDQAQPATSSLIGVSSIGGEVIIAPLRRAQFVRAMSATLPGGVSAFLNAGWISASPDDASNIAWTHEPFVDPAGSLAVLVTSYLTAATTATPAGLGMMAPAAAMQIAALFASAATQPN